MFKLPPSPEQVKQAVEKKVKEETDLANLRATADREAQARYDSKVAVIPERTRVLARQGLGSILDCINRHLAQGKLAGTCDDVVLTKSMLNAMVPENTRIKTEVNGEMYYPNVVLFGQSKCYWDQDFSTSPDYKKPLKNKIYQDYGTALSESIRETYQATGHKDVHIVFKGEKSTCGWDPNCHLDHAPHIEFALPIIDDI